VIRHDSSGREDPAVAGSSKAVQITVSARTLAFIAVVTAAAAAIFAIRGALVLVFAGIFIAFVF